MANAAEIPSDIHSLIVNPGNSSLVLGAADYLTHRPLQYLLRKVTGNSEYKLHGALSPAKWGEQVARAGEKADHAVGTVTGGIRKEDLKLAGEHLANIHKTLHNYETSNNPESVTHGKKLRASLDNLFKTHDGRDLNTVLEQHHADPNFAITLHGVKLPSATGEVGKHVKNLGTDAAAFVGTGAIMNQIQQQQAQAHTSPEGSKAMEDKIAKIQQALNTLEKVAEILADIPKRDEAYKRANDLHLAGAISTDEIDKYASVFYTSPEASEVLVQTAQRIAPEHAKSARLGEVVPATQNNTTDKETSGGGNSFDNFCRSGIGR